jgi:TonB-dependent receptor
MNQFFKIKCAHIIIVMTLLLLFCVINVHAQGKGSISGTISDGLSNSTLPGASIIIEGTQFSGTTSDIHGRFVLNNIPTGDVKLRVSFLGFTTEFVSVLIAENETKNISIALMPDVHDLKEVVISSQALGQSRAINQQLSSDAIVNIVSGDKLKELPDVNAAEALGRLPGVALQRSAGEGQKVLVRGMNPTFSAITINGIRIPSNDPTDRSVNLTMVSSESLAGIELFKSPTPDMDGEAVGGTVNLLLRKAPDKQSLDFKASGAYNQLSNDFKNYNISGTYSNRFFEKKLGLILQGNAERINRGSELFGGTYDFLDVILPTRFNLTHRLETRKRIGGSINVDYRLPKGDITFFSYYGQTNRDEELRSQTYDPYDYNTIRFGYDKKDGNLDLWSNMLSGNHSFNSLKFDWSVSYSTTNNNTPYHSSIWFWDDGAYSHNPDIGRNFEAWADSSKTDYTRAYLREASLISSSFNESNYSASFNVEIPFQLGENINGSLKTGGKYRSLERDYEIERLAEEFYYLGGAEMQNAIKQYPKELEMTPNNRIAMTNMVGDNPYEIGNFLDNAYYMNNPMNSGLVRDWFDNQVKILNNDRNALAEAYSLVENVAAAYGMLRLVFFKQFTIITGARIEQSDNTYNAIASTLSGRYGINGALLDTTTTQKYTEILPHMHLRYKPFNWFDVRFSYARTLARPSFDMLIPRSAINFNNATIRAGNPNLKHMIADNYDLTMSFYNGKYGLFAVSGFYKDLKNIFFQLENYSFTSDSIAESFGYPGRKDYILNSFDNSPKASVYGIEIDLQTNLNFLPEPFSGFVLSANITKQLSETYKYTYLRKDTLYRDPVTRRPVRESTLTEDKRKISMPGQAPLIFNFSIGYDLKGFSGRVSANYQDNYLIFPGSSPIQDNINWNFWRFDVALKQKLSSRFSLFLNLNNVNNMREERFRNYDTEFPSSIQNYGPVYNMGIQLKL